jgi:hypothetical protein
MSGGQSTHRQFGEKENEQLQIEQLKKYELLLEEATRGGTRYSGFNKSHKRGGSSTQRQIHTRQDTPTKT